MPFEAKVLVPSPCDLDAVNGAFEDAANGMTTKVGAANQWNATLSLTVPALVPTTWSGVSRARDTRDQALAGVPDVSRALAATVARAYLGA